MIAQVIAIPNKYNIIINSGATDNFLNIGDKVKVFEIGPEIIDPFSKKSLGNYEFLKAILEVENISDYYAVCVKKELKKSIVLSPLENLTKTYHEYIELPIDENEISDLKFTPKSQKIKIGDYVSLITNF